MSFVDDIAYKNWRKIFWCWLLKWLSYVWRIKIYFRINGCQYIGFSAFHLHHSLMKNENNDKRLCEIERRKKKKRKKMMTSNDPRDVKLRIE